MKIHKLSDNSEVFDAYSKVINKYNNKFYKKSYTFLFNMLKQVTPELAQAAGKTLKELAEQALVGTGKNLDDLAIELFKNSSKNIDEIKDITGLDLAAIHTIYKNNNQVDEFIRLAGKNNVPLDQIANVTGKSLDEVRSLLRLPQSMDVAAATALRNEFDGYFRYLNNQDHYRRISNLEGQIATKIQGIINAGKTITDAEEAEIKTLIQQHKTLFSEYFTEYKKLFQEINNHPNKDFLNTAFESPIQTHERVIAKFAMDNGFFTRWLELSKNSVTPAPVLPNAATLSTDSVRQIVSKPSADTALPAAKDLPESRPPAPAPRSPSDAGGPPAPRPSSDPNTTPPATRPPGSSDVPAAPGASGPIPPNTSPRDVVRMLNERGIEARFNRTYNMVELPAGANVTEVLNQGDTFLTTGQGARVFRLTRRNATSGLDVTDTGMVAQPSGFLNRWFNSFVDQSAKQDIKNTSPSTVKAFAFFTAKAGVAITGIAALLVVGFKLIVSAATVYGIWNLFKEDPFLKDLFYDKLVIDLNNARAALDKLKFKAGSNGETKTRELIQKIDNARDAITKINKENPTDQEVRAALEIIDDLMEAIPKYPEVDANNKSGLIQDLEDPATEPDFDEAVRSIGRLLATISGIKAQIIIGLSETPLERGPAATGLAGGGAGGRGGGIGGQAAESDEGGGGRGGGSVEAEVPEVAPDTAGSLRIFDKYYDVSNLSVDFKNALPDLLSGVLQTPAALALLNPEQPGNVGIAGEDGDNYFAIIRQIYMSGARNNKDVIEFIKSKLENDLTKKSLIVGKIKKYKDSTFRNRWGSDLLRSKQQYFSADILTRRERRRMRRGKSAENFTQNFEKTANSEISSVIRDMGIEFNMQKKADEFSKQYYRDAISGLEKDPYAKSYFTGLKGMYNEKPSKTKADYKMLYELHDETGPELIGKAHPKTIDIADAMGRGGVVENQIEQQRHNIGVAQSVPSGNFRGRYAWVIQNLVKLAEIADDKGLIQESDLIDSALSEIIKL
jgi:hypothetical protein